MKVPKQTVSNLVEGDHVGDEIKETVTMCPFLKVPCVAYCPAWVEPLADCLFYLCLTEVKETFLSAARYFDEQASLGGVGEEMMTELRGVLCRTSSEDRRSVVVPVLASMFGTLALHKVMGMDVESITGLLTEAELRISFDLDGDIDG